MMEQEIEDLTMEVQDLESVLATSRQELDECKARESQAQEQLLNFTRQLEKKNRECAAAQAEVFRLNRAREQEADITLTRQQLREAERQLEQAMVRETELDAKLSKSTEYLQQFQTEISMRESEFRADISGLKEQLRAFQGENEDINKECEKLRISEHNTQQTLIEVQTEFDSHKRRAADLESDLTRRHQNARDELTHCQNRVQQLNDQLNDALQSERRLKTMSSEAHAVAESLQAARVQSEKDFTERLQAMEEELQRAQAKVLHYKSREQELTVKEAALSNRIRDMEDELRVVQNNLRDNQAALHHANTKISELSDKNSQQKLDRSKLEEEAMTTKDILSRDKQKLAAKLSAAEDAVRQLEEQLSETKLALRRSQDQGRDLEAKAKELERNLATSHTETQALSDDFTHHSKARDWQLEALKTRLQIADDKAKQACLREDSLLQQLEVKQAQTARLECESVQKEMECRQEIDALRLKIKSLENVLGHTKKDNESLHRLLEMPAEEFAFQAIERSGPMARTFRKSELPGKRASMDGRALPPPVPRKSLMPPEDQSLYASLPNKSLSARNICDESNLPERDADLQQQVLELRAKMKAMEMEVMQSPRAQYSTGDTAWETSKIITDADKQAVRGVIKNTSSPMV
jgi:chromosome segregation ATPase